MFVGEKFSGKKTKKFSEKTHINVCQVHREWKKENWLWRKIPCHTGSAHHLIYSDSAKQESESKPIVIYTDRYCNSDNIIIFFLFSFWIGLGPA